MTRFRAVSFFISICAVLTITLQATADPWPDEALKFYQMPLNNGLTPYLPGVPTYPPTTEYGTVHSTAIYPGHDELSTAWRTNPNVPYQGTYMADDFADYANTPVTHVRWWGSYIDQQQIVPPGGGVRRFLISFEHNVPAVGVPGTPGYIESHPDFFHPGNLHQIVELEPGVAPPPAGKFTEKPIPIGAGPPPREALYEYNAELNLGKWFNEQAAEPGKNNVYWLKIVALVDVNPTLPPIEWGWHNRDWSIPNALAAKPGDTPDGAERGICCVPGSDGTGQPVWHFEDDAVSGGIFVTPNPAAPNMPIVDQTTFDDQNYDPLWDGPTPIIQFSKDLAFELYTRPTIPEPTSAVLLMLGMVGYLGYARRKR